MYFDEYQKLAKRTINIALTKEEKTLHALHGLAGEVGEIHSLYQKVYQGHKMDMDHLEKEIGDLLWFIAELCEANHLKMNRVAQGNIDKLMKRYPKGFETERSLVREEGDI